MNVLQNNIAVIFAVAAMLGAVFNDIVFKMYVRKNGVPIGEFMALTGLTAIVLLGAVFGVDLHKLAAVLPFGIPIGVFAFSANLLLIQAMKYRGAGTCATIFRLNLMVVVLFSWLFLGESISNIKFVGIICALAAVLCFLSFGAASGASANTAGRYALLGIFLAIVAACLRAGMSITSKVAVMDGADSVSLVIVNETVWLVCGSIYSIVAERKSMVFNYYTLKYGILSGLCGVCIVTCQTFGLLNGDASIVIPIASMSFPFTMLIGVGCLGEQIFWRKVIGLFFAIAAMLLLCLA